MDAASFLPLRSVEVDILIAVAEGPTHGYAILKQAEERTGGHPGFEIPTLYRALRRMKEDGLVRSLSGAGDEPDGRNRQYWQATPLGRDVLAAEIDRLEKSEYEGLRFMEYRELYMWLLVPALLLLALEAVLSETWLRVLP